MSKILEMARVEETVKDSILLTRL